MRGSFVVRDSKLRAVTHISKSVAIARCEEYAKSVAMNPSTVEFSKVLDLSVDESPNGRTTVTSTFKARNSFNLEEKFKISCLQDASGLFEVNISEPL
jgi:hypothetical protein